MDKRLKEILVLEESVFRKEKHTDILIGLLREREDWIQDNILTIMTNLKFNFQSPEIVVFNEYLRILRNRNTIAIRIVLDK